ncbi:hypothetical protein [Anabaena sp. 4-3]|uniref:hypothetical protein n=1 Tax=Anabaena sp. 4-3 TaxID=1811979 RepID=UPI00082F8586|nr:hypothetical protein [Anabaena sp. 4-3]
MQTIKRKQIAWIMFLLLGVGYFSVMSNLEIHYFWKSLIALMPIQVGTAIYVTFQRWISS